MTPKDEAAPAARKSAASDSDLILKLLEARLELADLNREHAQSGREQVPSTALSSVHQGNRGTDSTRADTARQSSGAFEMTPTPMVVAAGRAAMASNHALTESRRSEPAAADSARQMADGGDDAFDGVPEYHPPRPPPTSIAPAPVASSISVATEYDPKAPTRPRLRRNTSAPPPPLLFGLDRMLIWGLVLGGLFVAVIIVIVDRLALKSTQQPHHDSGDTSVAGEPPPDPSPVLPESTQRASGTSVVEPSRLNEAADRRAVSGTAGAVQSMSAKADEASGGTHAGTKVAGSGGKPAARSSVRNAPPPEPSEKKIWIE